MLALHVAHPNGKSPLFLVLVGRVHFLLFLTYATRFMAVIVIFKMLGVTFFFLGRGAGDEVYFNSENLLWTQE